MTERADDSLNIVHVLRAAVGGLFRHVVDLARAQHARGHRIGIIADARTGGAQAESVLAALSSDLALGVSRFPMSRHLGWRDLAALRHVGHRLAASGANVVHGHGAKGGAYARLASAPDAIRVYTPHGGSLHYEWGSTTGFLYLALERILMNRTDLLLCESAYGRNVFESKIGRPAGLTRVVHNGVAAEEFEPIETMPQATDLVFVGELRHLKGIDVLIEALALLAASGRQVSLTIVGEGADRAKLETQATALGLAGTVHFVGAMPARTAFARGRVVVVPSRAESLPYIVLEAAAAGRPLIATKVGGMAEIFGTDADRLVPAGDAAALAYAIAAALDDPGAQTAAAARLQTRIRGSFSVDAMADAVIAGYRAALARR
jgi:glycosyltransferase involved in cell wall biosynthesis